MSKNTTEADLNVVNEKKSLRQKILAPIKNHPKLAIAVAAGVALVAGAAILSKDDFSNDEPAQADPDTLTAVES